MKDEKEKNSRRTPTVSRKLPSGDLLELVYNPATRSTGFILGNKDSWKYIKHFKMSKTETLVPYSANNSLLRHRVVLFPSYPEEYGSEKKLISDIQAYMQRYLSVSTEFAIVAAYYVFLTWVYDRYNELPYLRAMGDFGSGKTRFLLTIGSICYKPMFASGASSISPLFRIIDIFRGTLLVDEADFRMSDDKAEIVKILNNGNARGFPVLRSEQSSTNEYHPKAFDVFGPKLVATRNQYQDAALESRFITEDMNTQSLAPNVPISLPSSQAHEALSVRNKLLMFRLQNALIETALETSGIDVEPRLVQIFAPLLSLIHDDREKIHVHSLLQKKHNAMTHDRRGRIEYRLLQVMSDLDDRKKNRPISVGEISAAFQERYAAEYVSPITPRWIGAQLRNRFGILTIKRNGNYIIRTDQRDLLNRLMQKHRIRRNSK